MSKSVSNTIYESKKKSISQIASIGRKHKLLKYPILLFLVLFIFVYNFAYYFCLHFKMKERTARVLATAMCVVLFVTSVDITAFAFTGGSTSDKTIVAADSLIDEIANQRVTPEATLEDIKFPESIDVHVTYQVEKEVAQEASVPATSEEQITVEETTSAEEQMTDEESSSSEESSQPEETTECEEVEATEEPEGEAAESQPEEEPSDELTDAWYDGIETVYVPMKYCAAEPSEEGATAETLQADEQDDKNVTYKTVLEEVEEDTAVAVTWSTDEERSSKAEFKDLEVGEKYVFVPTITEDGYRLAEGVELPVIAITIGEGWAFEKAVTLEDVTITVLADEGVFPEGATIEARKVTTSEEKEVEEAIDEVRDEEKNVAVSYTFDITIYDKDGNEIEPDTSKGSVKVTFKMAEIANENLETDVYHVEETDEGLNAEGLDVNTEEGEADEAAIETDGFSFYTVEFTYGELQYVLEGDERVELTTILEAVGIKANGEITEVVGSKDELFKPVLDEAENIWYIEAVKAFSSKEWLKVTIDGIVYEIVVTDDITGPTAYVNNYEELVSAIGNSSVTKVVVQENIDVPCVTAPTEVTQNAQTAQININHSLVIEGANRDVTIKRVPAEGATRNSLVSIFEIEGNNSTTNNIEVIIRNITIHGGCDDFSAENAPTAAPGINTPVDAVAGRSIIDVYKLATLTVENATIRNGITCNCISTHGFDNGAYGYGGAIRVEFSIPNNLAGGTVNIKVGSLITTCAATISQTDWSIGGAIGCFNKGHLNLYGGTITNCYATIGGAIGTNARSGATDFDDAGTISMYGGEISSCYAGQGGAIAYLRGTSACQNYIYGGSINNCHSGHYLRSGDVAYGDAIAIDSKWKTEKIQVTLPAKETNMLQITNCNGGTNNNSTNKSGGTHYYSGIYLFNNTTTDNKILIEETVKLSFKLSESEDYGQIIIKKGTFAGASFPGDPIKENKEFVSWYKEGDTTYAAVTKDTVFESDATLLPLWCHEFQYAGSGNKLTATCSNSYCKLPEKSVAVCVDAPDADNTGLMYDVSKVVLSDVSTFNSLTGKSLSVDDAIFYTDEACTKKTSVANDGAESEGGAPKNIGTYYIKVTIPGTSAYAVDSFKISSKHNHDNIDFTLWTSTTSLPTSAGNYCLANDVELSGTWKVPTGTVNLCLNGHVIKLKSGSNGSVIYINNNGTNFNLYDCDTTTEHYFDTSTAPWKLTDTAGTDTYTVKGGVITGGTGTVYNQTTYGGGVYLYLNDYEARTSFKMYGGNIVGNSSTQSGGGVCIRHDQSTFDMYGGTVQGNYCVANSGGISVHNGTVNLRGGQISYNKTDALAGGVLLYQGVLNVTDTIISNNEAGTTAGGLEVFNPNFTIGGSAKIVDNIANGKDSNLYFDKPYVMKFCTGDDAPSGMEVGVTTASNKPIAISVADNTDYSQYFTSDDSNYTVYYKDADKKLYLGNLPTVNVDLNGGSYPDGSTALEGWIYNDATKLYTKKGAFKVKLPIAPTSPTGKTFKGWEYSTTVENAGTEITLADAENRTYKAKYEINKYTVAFDVQSHSTAPSSLTDVEHGAKITKPTDPSESGYVFGGWYRDADCTNAWNFETDTVISDMTLYAKWIEPKPDPTPTPKPEPKPEPGPEPEPEDDDPTDTPVAKPKGSYAETGLTTKRYVVNGGLTAGIENILGTNNNQIALPYVTEESEKAGWTSIDAALKSYKKTRKSSAEPFSVTMNGYATVDNQLLSDVNTQKVDLALNLDNDVVVVVPKENKVISDAIKEWNAENAQKPVVQGQQPKLSEDVYFRVSAITTNDAKANRMTNAGLDMQDIKAIGGDADTPVVKVVTSNTAVGMFKSRMILITFDTTGMTKYKPGDMVYLYNGSAKAGVGCYTVGRVDKNGKVSFWVPMVSSYWTIGDKNLGSRIMKRK